LEILFPSILCTCPNHHNLFNLTVSVTVGLLTIAQISLLVIVLLLVFSPWAGLAGTRVQSGNRYGSGTLHSGQVLRGSLPLLSPAFRRSNFHRQMPPRPQQHQHSW
jgi:uncharacterized membrane protein